MYLHMKDDIGSVELLSRNNKFKQRNGSYVWIDEGLGELSDANFKLYPANKYYGFLKEKSFLRNEDLKTKQTSSGKELFYPDKQMVNILGENGAWLLVEAEAMYRDKGIDIFYSKGHFVPKIKGWIKKDWTNIKQRITFPVRAVQITDEHIGQVVEIKAKVKAKLGIKLHGTPNPASKLIDSKIYPQNSDVTIIGLPASYDDPNWYKIRAIDGKEGWIESRYVVQLKNKDFDLLIKEYYVATQDDKLEPLVKSRYSQYNIKTGDDFRTIVHAFSILNDGNPAIYYKGESDSWWRDKVFDKDMAGTRRIYASIKLRKGGLIYFPTDSYINYLKDSGKVGRRPDWKNDAIDFGKAIISFAEGFYESISKILADIWDDIKSLFSLSFFKDIYNLIKEIIDNPGILIQIVKEMFKGIESILKSLSSSVASVKYKAYGSLIGMISGTLIMTMLVPGSSGTKGISATRKLKVIQKIEKQLGNVAKDSKKFDYLRKKLIKYSAQQKKWVDTWGGGAGKIIDTVDSRHKLRNALDLQVGDARQAHHIIPIDVLKNNPTIQKAVIEGFDFNGKINGIPVPPKFHLAGHDEIHKLINEEINEWAKLNRKASGKKINEYLETDFIPRMRRAWKGAENLIQRVPYEDDHYRKVAYQLFYDILRR